MMPYPTPAEAADAATSLIGMGSEIYTNGQKSLKYGWVLAGGGLGIYPGEPDGVFAAGTAPVELLPDETQDALRTAILDSQSNDASFGAGAAAIDPQLIALVMQLVMWFLNRKK